MGTDNLFSDPTTYGEADDGASATVKRCPRPTVVHVVGQVIELAVTADEEEMVVGDGAEGLAGARGFHWIWTSALLLQGGLSAKMRWLRITRG